MRWSVTTTALLEALLHRLRFFTGGRFFARIDRWKKGPSAQKRRIRPILAHEPGVFGAWEPHIVENHHVTVMQNG